MHARSSLAIVAPEPDAPWLAETIALARAAGLAPHVIVAPCLVGLGVRAWARGAVDRQMQARFATRAGFDAFAATRLARLPALAAVIAPAGGARRTFAAAQRLGARCLLMSDLPCLRRMHRDLDRAAHALPARRFLRRYRADRDALIRQEAEWVLADRVIVRGAYARGVIARALEPARVLAWPRAPIAARAPRRGGDVLLAGLACARMGVDAALAACRAVDRSLRVRVGDGTEPADLLAHRGVTPAADLDGIGAVIAPAWCESYPRELAIARAHGIPIVATRAAAGFEPASEIVAGDPDALTAVLARALACDSPSRDDGAVRFASDRAALIAALAIAS